MIRAAEQRDIAVIEAHSKVFWEQGYIDVPYRDGSALPLIELCLSQKLLLVGEIDGDVVGFAAGCKVPLMGDNTIIQGTELAWWVAPEHRGGRVGLQLLKGLEQAAKNAGCTYWSMVYMESSMPKTIRDIYLKLGYRLNETTYGKRL